MDPYSSPYVTHDSNYSSFHFLFHSLNWSPPRAYETCWSHLVRRCCIACSTTGAYCKNFGLMLGAKLYQILRLATVPSHHAMAGFEATYDSAT